MPGTAVAQKGVWGGWLSKKPFQKELAMHGLTFDPGQRWVLLLVAYKSNLDQNFLFIDYYYWQHQGIVILLYQHLQRIVSVEVEIPGNVSKLKI
jgi:hypothetical protein